MTIEKTVPAENTVSNENTATDETTTTIGRHVVTPAGNKPIWSPRGDNPTQALEGLRVIDAGHLLSGPFAASLLADMGADVIKVEQPKSGDAYRAFAPDASAASLGWKWLSRNKRSVTLDLRQERGRDVFKQLVAEADIVVMSFKPATIDRLGLDYESLSKVNPRLIEVLISGFGQTGPWRDRAGFGTLGEAMSGYADQTGEPGGTPIIPAFPLADSVAGMYAAIGALSALHHRENSPDGRGQLVDSALLEGLFSILGPAVSWYDRLGYLTPRTGARSIASAPRNVYRTRDGRWIALAAAIQGPAIRLFTVMGHPEWREDERFNTPLARVKNVDVLDPLVAAWFASLDFEDIIRRLEAADVPCAPIMNASHLIEHPQMLTREAIIWVDDPTDPEIGENPLPMGGVFPKLSHTPAKIRNLGEQLGASNDEVYRELLGLSEEEISQLQEDGII